MNGWQIELWTRPPSGILLWVGFDPAEAVVHYKDALKVYPESRLWLMLSAGFEVYEITYRDLRDRMKQEYSVP